MRADDNVQSEIRNAITKLADSYEKRDLSGFMACFAANDDTTLIGTGADEKRIGSAEIEAQVRRDWDQTDAIAMRLNTAAVSGSGNVAWATTDGTFEIKVGGQNIAVPARVTLVFERQNGTWLIVQSHFSTPHAEQEEGQSVPA